MISSEQLKSILRKHREDIEFLKEKMENLSEENKNLKENYNKLTNKFIDVLGNEDTPKVNIQLDMVQMLTILRNAQAITLNFAITAGDLKRRFNISGSEKNIRNKLNKLVIAGLANSIGERPKKFFLLGEGISILKKEEKGILQVKI